MSRSGASAALLLAFVVAVSCLAHTCSAVDSTMLVGGVSQPHGEVSPEARQAALFAVQTLNADAQKRAAALGSANGGEVTLLDITGVRTQVVAGINYILTLKLSDGSNAPHQVEAKVWARPWLEGSNSGEAAWQLTDVKPV